MEEIALELRITYVGLHLLKWLKGKRVQALRYPSQLMRLSFFYLFVFVFVFRSHYWCSGITPSSGLRNYSWEYWGILWDAGDQNLGQSCSWQTPTYCAIALPLIRIFGAVLLYKVSPLRSYLFLGVPLKLMYRPGSQDYQVSFTAAAYLPGPVCGVIGLSSEKPMPQVSGSYNDG